MHEFHLRSTLYYFYLTHFLALCVLLSPGSSAAGLGTLDDAIITQAFNSILIQLLSSTI